ncbi:Cell morphogenesis protein PAG1 [Coemansia brasiliensis]|uniref:Cell morphogenesis protein PAG1 n=1 Tax=Coemansia brasiliensis TaxID=2650707 RepID=A0A9W8IGI9_9FUNG|nr:Cell morphogenesis protein PAG1 [Coemansia brasiliensis]
MTASANEPDNNGGGAKREPRPNPFGNYSLLEAQQSTRPSRLGGSSSNNSGCPPVRASPFANYSFKEAQQNGLAPPSPTTSAYGSSVANSNGGGSQSAGEKAFASETQQQAAGSGTREAFMLSADNASADNTAHLRRASEISQTPMHFSSVFGPEMGSGFSQRSGYSAAAMSIEQYAIRTLYEEFRDRAAGKIDTIVELRLDREPNLAKYLQPGADSIFDRTLEKLGVMARRRPRVIIELLLVWRKATIDAAEEDPLDAPGLGGLSEAARRHQHQSAALSRAHYIVRERKSLVSVYILCRALGAVVEQLDASHLEGDLGDRLEELVFGQVKQVNPANLRRSQNRREIQDLYAQLIGRISQIRFLSMSDRFIAELERIPMVSSGSDERIVELLHNMRFIKLRVYPIDALEESSAFLLSCAKFYSRTSGSLRLKHAWATLLTELLMPIAAVVDVEVNLPELVQAIDIIYAKAMKMAAKVRHVTVAFPLVAATLCISRRETFHQRWLSLLEYCIQRLKDKQFRRVSMDAILRMLWVYLFRYPEANNVVLRRIDSLSRIFFPATKLHAWPKTVPPSAFVYFLVCAACYNFEFAMRQMLQNMLQVDSGWPGTTRDIGDAGPILDTLNPARVALAFQALVSVAAIVSKDAASTTSAATAAAAGGASGIGDGIGGGFSTTAALGGSGDGSSGAAVLIRPPFPGVSQLSGLDVFAAEHQLQSKEKGISSKRAKSSRAGDIVRGSEIAIINPDILPDNISNALTTAISVVSRYCSVLNPVFGRYLLADERLWRHSCSIPLFSSTVLIGSAFSSENTALATHGLSRDLKTASSQAAGAASGSLVGVSASPAAGSSSLANTAMTKSASDEANDWYHLDEASGSVAAGGDNAVSSSNSLTSSLQEAAEAARRTAPSYSSDRQAYVDLMTAYVRNMPRAQLFWEQIGSQKLVETLVQNVLHIDQELAAESRACLLDLLCPPSLLISESGSNSKPSMFANQTERLTGITQAVVCATQLLRATDERYSAVLIAGIFTRDARSNMSLAQPGDPLTDTPGLWPYCLSQSSADGATSSSRRRFAHATNLSTASAASNGLVLPQLLSDYSGRHCAEGTSAQSNARDDHMIRHTYSSSGQLGSADESDIDAGQSSGASAAAAAAAIAAALDAKSRHETSSVSEPTACELNGGFLHMYLDLIHFLEISLHEFLTQDGGFRDGLSMQADSDDNVADAGPEADPSEEPTIGDRNLVEWAKLVSAIEANAVAMLCSSNAQVRHLAVDVLYQAGILRRILASYEPVPQLGQSWLFRNCDSAYEVLNMPVPPRQQDSLPEPLNEFWNVPFGSEPDSNIRSKPTQNFSLARAAAGTSEYDVQLWSTYFPVFIRRASAQIPYVMLVSRALVCQRLYQMQPLMTQYSDASVRALGLRTVDAKAGSNLVRIDLVSAFGSLFLFAVVSLPSSNDFSLASNRLGDSASGYRSPRNNVAGNNSSVTLGNTSSGGNSVLTGNASSSGRSRLAKSIARKLAPLKSNSRGSRQEQGAGLASISQLVRVAGVMLRSDNAPLRQLISYALSSTPETHLHELMQELRPLADALLDDGPAQTAHRNYLHVSNNAAAGNSSTGLLISSLSHHYHGLTNSPGGGSAVGSSSPKPAGQLAPQASKRRMAKAGSGSRVRDGGLGSDSEAASDSGATGQARSGRRANSFDAAAVSSALSAKKPGENAQSEADSSSANVAAVNAGAAGVGGASTTAVQIQRRRRRLLRLSLAQIYKHVSRQLDATNSQGRALWQDENVLGQMVAYIRETKTFLADGAVQWEWEHQPLRAHFCGLVEGLYYFMSSGVCTDDSNGDIETAKHSGARGVPKTSMFTHETRNGLYQLFERWCGLGRFAESARESQSRMIGSAIDHIKDSTERESMAVVLETEHRMLERAALRAMAVLCRSGCLQQTDGEKGTAEPSSEADGPREKAALFAWVSDALAGDDMRVQLIGQNAIKWTILADVRDTAMMRVVIQLAYGIKAAISSFASADTAMANVPHASNNTSGLGLMLGINGNDGLSKRRVPSDAVTTSAALTNESVLLGYLQALTAVLAPSFQQSKLKTLVISNSNDSGNISTGRAISQTYVGLLLPLALFHLQSSQRRVRRQALVLLRTLCVHTADACLGRLDELGPSIVSDIPAIALSAVEKLSEVVATALAAHTGTVIEEVVRQVHTQRALDRQRTDLLRSVLQPWLCNVDLAAVNIAGDELEWRLEPIALDRDSVRVLRCMLFLTVCTGAENLAGMQGLWMALVERGIGHGANLWLVVRYLTALLVRSWSATLLNISRRIAVFMSRSSQGEQLVRLFIDEAVRPGATAPLNIPDDVDIVMDVLADEAWADQISHLLSGQGQRLVSTGGLAMFYLSAISYEQPQLLAEHRQLSIVPGALFMLAHPERWVRNSARMVLVNLVAAERAACGDATALVNETVHYLLTVLRSNECLRGFGNVEESTSLDSEATSGSDEFLPSKWASEALVPNHDTFGGSSASERRRSASLGPLDASEEIEELSKEATDSSLVADAADMPAMDIPHSESPSKSSRSPPSAFQRRSSLGRRSADAGTPIDSRALLQRFVGQQSRLFERRFAGCAQEWANVAVQWAMQCPVRAQASLALQTFGMLVAEARQGRLEILPTRVMVLRLIDRLSNVVGDASEDVAAFSTTVVAALRQAAALVARVSSEDSEMVADLLAASLTLMRTCQDAGIFSMALSIFERMFRLETVAADEKRFRSLTAMRAGELASDGYQSALLRGLEFAVCRGRCLMLLRETLSFDLAAAGAAVHPMLALAVHLPAIIDDTLRTAAEAQRAVRDATGPADLKMPNDSELTTPGRASELGKTGRRTHRSNYRRAPPPPGAAISGFGSSLGLMFGGSRDNSAAAPPSMGASESQSSLGSPRRQLFKRRRPPMSSQAKDGKAEDSINDTTGESEQLGTKASTAEIHGSHQPSVYGSEAYEKYIMFVDECALSLQTKGHSRDKDQLMQQLANLLAPVPAGLSPMEQAHVESRESIRQFGYAVVECGSRVAAEIATALLQLLRPSMQTQVALRYLQDEQAAWTVGDQAAEVDGYAAELRQIYVCLQLLYSIVTASGDNTGSGTLRLNSSMAAAGLRHLFDLLIVARPISDMASQVLHTLLQRFDEVPPVSAGSMRIHWYESDADVLQSVARSTLAGIVALGFDDAESMALSSCHGVELAKVNADSWEGAARSVSPEMPVLVIPDEDEVRVERLANALHSGVHISDSSQHKSLLPVSSHTDNASQTVTSSDDPETSGLLAELDEFDRELDALL